MLKRLNKVTSYKFDEMSIVRNYTIYISHLSQNICLCPIDVNDNVKLNYVLMVFFGLVNAFLRNIVKA